MENLSDAKLKALLKSLGGRTAGRQRRETMIKRINQLTTAANRPAPNAVEAVLGITPAPATDVFRHAGISQEQVLDAVKHCVARGMAVSFHENSWTFTLKGRVDSGTMRQPIGNIVKCGDILCRDTRAASIDGDKPVYA